MLHVSKELFLRTKNFFVSTSIFSEGTDQGDNIKNAQLTVFENRLNFNRTTSLDSYLKRPETTQYK